MYKRQPDGVAVADQNQPSSKERVVSFVNLIQRYVDAGGGVLLFPEEKSVRKQFLQDLTDHWGAKLPLETIVESDQAKVGQRCV